MKAKHKIAFLIGVAMVAFILIRFPVLEEDWEVWGPGRTTLVGAGNRYDPLWYFHPKLAEDDFSYTTQKVIWPMVAPVLGIGAALIFWGIFPTWNSNPKDNP